MLRWQWVAKFGKWTTTEWSATEWWTTELGHCWELGNSRGAKMSIIEFLGGLTTQTAFLEMATFSAMWWPVP